MKLVVATKNEHKIKEFRHMLEPLGYEILSLFDFADFPEIIEDKDTFKGNALKKAKELSDYLKLDVIADDSGLEVFALNNEPGAYSARYAGEDKSYHDNNHLLLTNLEGIEDRRARFVTSLCVYYRDKEPLFMEEYLYGKIAYEYKGENGFGYDPIFIPDGDSRHLAEYSMSEKNEISHRGKCLKKLITFIK